MAVNSSDSQDPEIFRRIHNDLVDSFDEELEMEVEDGMLPEWQVPETQAEKDAAKAERREYFRELFRMQGELVKLQEWIVATGHKLVVLFEGRDAAGKGGVIKRIAQRLNPRVCRVAALPAPNSRERTQWYFQRYTTHLPAAGEIGLIAAGTIGLVSNESWIFAPTKSPRNSSAPFPNSRECSFVLAFS